jgi:hypothetical protein
MAATSREHVDAPTAESTDGWSHLSEAVSDYSDGEGRLDSDPHRGWSDDLLPVGASEPADAGGGGAIALVTAHETPGDRGLALCLPCLYRAGSQRRR